MIGKGIILRNFQDGDEKQIIPILKSAFKKNKFDNDTYWNWFYNENPLKYHKNWIIESEKKIIGHQGLIPQNLIFNRREILCYFTANLAISKNYQGCGLFSILAAKIQNEINSDNPLFIYGYPNKKSYYTFKYKLKWNEIKLRPVLIKSFDLKKTLTDKISDKWYFPIIYLLSVVYSNIFYREYTSDENITVTNVSSFDERSDRFWKEISSELKIATIRDCEYLNWRYVKNPTNHYTIFIAEEQNELVGYIVLKLSRINEDATYGIIVDLVTKKNDKIMNVLLRKSIDFFKSQNSEFILCYIHHKWYYKNMKKHGFIPLYFNDKRQHLIIKFEVTNKKLLRSLRKNWFLTWGDWINEI